MGVGDFALGTLTSLAGLASRDNRAYFCFRGDLSTMGSIAIILRQRGYPIVFSDVFPGFTRDQENLFVEALRYLFINRIDGWQSQERALIRHKVCTQEDFNRIIGKYWARMKNGRYQWAKLLREAQDDAVVFVPDGRARTLAKRAKKRLCPNKTLRFNFDRDKVDWDVVQISSR